MIAITIIVLALALAFPVKESVDNARNGTTFDGTIGLDCSNASISDYNKGACVTTDLTIFYFIGGIIFIAGAVVAARFVFGGS